jgi:hypothetical protein
MFEIQRQGNGYLQLRTRRPFHAATTLEVTLVSATNAATILVMADAAKWPRISGRQRRHVTGLLETLRADTEAQVSQLDLLDDVDPTGLVAQIPTDLVSTFSPPRSRQRFSSSASRSIDAPLATNS